jgi:hypothetical protein
MGHETADVDCVIEGTKVLDALVIAEAEPGIEAAIDATTGSEISVALGRGSRLRNGSAAARTSTSVQTQ